MTDDPRIQQLLDELLDSDTTPEAVCTSCPELLPAVRKRWRRVRRLSADLDALFPPPDDALPPPQGTGLPQGTELPLVTGYEVEAILGRGGVGIVYRARHLRLNRLVALKMLLAGAYASPQERKRFQREAEAVARLQHPNIVQVHDVGDIEGRPYFTMEYVANGSLARKLAGVPQPAREAAQLVAILAGAVQAAHERGIVHRDLKPANVLLAQDGTPKVTDFGLARRQDEGAGLTQTGMAIGTPSYMAPEQARGRPDAVGPAVDVYALGAILYELLTGRPPFRAATSAETVQQVISQEPVPPSRLNTQVPLDLETICLKCLSKEPPVRYGSAAAMAEDVRRYLRGEPILARRASPAERLVKWTRRNRSLAASLVSGMLLLNVIVAVVVSILTDRNLLTRTVEADFREVVESQQRQAWGPARTALERAKARLGDGGPVKLQQRAGELERELTFVETLDHIRDGRQRWHEINFADLQIAADYEQAFRDAGLIQPNETSAVVAARIRSSVAAETTLVALDDWRMCDKGKQAWLNEVAQLVDQSAVTRKLRDPRVWDDKVALAECLGTAQIENQSVDLLVLAGRHLADLDGDARPFLQRVQEQYPDNFWVNSTLASILYTRGDSAEAAVRYAQAALATRPRSALAHGQLAAALLVANRLGEGLNQAQIAHQLDPTRSIYRVILGNILTKLGRFEEGLSHMIKACDIDAGHADWYVAIGAAYSEQHRHEDALRWYQRAIEANPKWWPAHDKLRETLQTLNRWEESQLIWGQLVALNPSDYQRWDGYAELCLYLGDAAEYRRTRSELLKRFGTTTDPRVAERIGRACLLLPAADDELLQATRLIDLAIASQRERPDWVLPYFRFAKALAEYRAGDLEAALALLDAGTLRILGPAPGLLLAMVQHRLGQSDLARHNLSKAAASYDWDSKKATDREAWMCHILRREAEAVLASTP